MTGIQAGDFNVSPQLAADLGYDTAPNGAGAASSAVTASPSVTVTNADAGFGAYAAGTATQYPSDAMQNDTQAVIAAGEKALLPSQALTLSAAWVNAQESGFALTAAAPIRPISLAVGDVRAHDDVTLDAFTLAPELSVTTVRFGTLAWQDRTDTREALTAGFAPGGTGEIILRAAAAQSRYADGTLNQSSVDGLAGIGLAAPDLWDIRALAGLAQRQPATGHDIDAPVVEVEFDWLPTRLDRTRLHLAHEIDDPDDISTVPYTLTEADVALRHAAQRDLTVSIVAQAEHAAYFDVPLRETLFTTDAAIAWQMTPALSLTADYRFNDRQANDLRAANDHILTMGLTWTP